MIQNLLAKVVGTQNDRDLKRLRPIVGQVGALEPAMAALTDEQLRDKTGEFRGRIARGETVDDLLVEAFAVVRREVGVTTVPVDALDDVVEVLARTPLANSRSDARRTLAQRGYRVNGQVLDDTTTSLAAVPCIEGRYLLLRRGKTSYHVVECASQG